MLHLDEGERAELDRQIRRGELVAETVVGVQEGPVVQDVYDAMVAEDSSFVADGIVVHNSEICRFLHGKTFSVGSALQRFERIEALEKPEDIKSEQPWVREARDPETGRKVLYVTKGETRVPIAEVVRSAVGSKDDVGEFGRGRGERELMDLGLSFPPYHGLCRTTVLPADAI